ncbi:MAG: thioredoxin [Oscillospiraceae bacterium]|jgi:thioredoxin|nr:thioredoxin [Oscillospiraceae bacterium]
MAGKVIEVNEKNFESALGGAKVTLADFWAPWCGPCRMVAPHVEAVAEKMDGEAAFIKINVDDNPSLAQRFGVMSIPTLVIFKDGEEAARMVGARGRADIESAVRQLI